MHLGACSLILTIVIKHTPGHIIYFKLGFLIWKSQGAHYHRSLGNSSSPGSLISALKGVSRTALSESSTPKPLS